MKYKSSVQKQCTEIVYKSSVQKQCTKIIDLNSYGFKESVCDVGMLLFVDQNIVQTVFCFPTCLHSIFNLLGEQSKKLLYYTQETSKLFYYLFPIYDLRLCDVLDCDQEPVFQSDPRVNCSKTTFQKVILNNIFLTTFYHFITIKPSLFRQLLWDICTACFIISNC